VVLDRLVREGRVKQRLTAPVEISQRLHALAGTGRRQREPQATGGHGPLPAAKRPVFATGGEQRCGKHPWARVSDHAQVSVIHRRLLALDEQQQHTQLALRMDHPENPP